MPQPSPAHLLPCTVALNEPIAPSMYRMRLACPQLAEELEPGQFFNLYVPGDPSQLLRLPFSWAVANKEEGWVEFSYLIVGSGTRRMAGLPVGTECNLLGPAGHGWWIPEGAKRALVVGGGSGVVPVVPLAGMLVEAGVACDFVQGAPTAERVIYEPEITASGAAFYVSTDDGTRGVHGFSTQVVAELLKQNEYDVVYACGPTPMMRAVAAQAAEAGIACQVSMEKLMACGFGACTTCLVDTKSGRKGACMTGPVFDAEEVLW